MSFYPRGAEPLPLFANLPASGSRPEHDPNVPRVADGCHDRESATAPGTAGIQSSREDDFELDLRAIVRPSYVRIAGDDGEGRKLTIAERFAIFHAANPHVFENLRRLAIGLIRRGRTHYSVDALFHILRFHYDIGTVDPTADFKLSNDYTSRYARLLIEQAPELADFFDLRPLRTA